MDACVFIIACMHGCLCIYHRMHACVQVFKKFTQSTLFPWVAADVVERFQLCMDALVVFLRMSTSIKRAPSSYFSVSAWLVSFQFHKKDDIDAFLFSEDRTTRFCVFAFAYPPL